jgi:hypothetical protein
MRFIVEVRIEGADRTTPSPVTVGVIERCTDSIPASGLGLLLQETKDLMQQLQTIVVAEQVLRFTVSASRVHS